jgi:hypothetical protein
LLKRIFARNTKIYLIYFSESEFAEGSYIAAYTCAEMGFMHLDNGDVTTGKHHLEVAR